jgi:orotate phosphoribosyltransferase
MRPVNTYRPIDNVVLLHEPAQADPDVNVQLALFHAGDSQQPDFSVPEPAKSLMTLTRARPDAGTSSSLDLVPAATGSTAPEQLQLFETPKSDELATRLAIAPGLVRAGAARWDGGRTPIHPLSMESAYADPRLLADLGAHGARFARELGVDVVVGAETAGVPLAASVSLAAGLPFAFVRKPGYRGHEADEPPVRGADVAGRRVLLVDDAVSSGTAVERFTAALAGAGAEVVGVFVLVDMREVADSVTRVAAALPTESVSTYLQVLALATAQGILDRAVHALSVDAIVNHWSEHDPRWDLLHMAA